MPLVGIDPVTRRLVPLAVETEHERTLRKIEEQMQRLTNLEKKYDVQFKMVFDAIRALMRQDDADQSRPPIGFHTELKGRDHRAQHRRR